MAETQKQSGPNLQALGLKSPMEVIDILGTLKIDGAPIVADEKAILNPQLKAETIMRYFHEKFHVKPNELPYIASIIKRELKNGNLKWSA
ncbi:MAG: hypothetical protein ABIH50_06995 [bacterium]